MTSLWLTAGNDLNPFCSATENSVIVKISDAGASKGIDHIRSGFDWDYLADIEYDSLI